MTIPIPAPLLAVLVCPRCKGQLAPQQDPPALDCPTCRLRYAVRDGIPIMLIDDAVPL
jgi:uncharacterized protein YbaR (Trm112 family)